MNSDLSVPVHESYNLGMETILNVAFSVPIWDTYLGRTRHRTPPCVIQHFFSDWPRGPEYELRTILDENFKVRIIYQEYNDDFQVKIKSGDRTYCKSSSYRIMSAFKKAIHTFHSNLPNQGLSEELQRGSRSTPLVNPYPYREDRWICENRLEKFVMAHEGAVSIYKADGTHPYRMRFSDRDQVNVHLESRHQALCSNVKLHSQ